MVRALVFLALLAVTMPADALQTDTVTVQTDTMRVVEVVAEKDLQVMDVLNKTLSPVKKAASRKTLTDYINKVVNTDYILHPFAFKERRREKHRKKMMKYLQEYDRVKTFEESLTEAIRQQQMEDSIKGR